MFGLFKKKYSPLGEHDPYDYDQVMERRLKKLTEGGWTVWYADQQIQTAYIGQLQQYKHDRVEFTRDFENVWIADPNALHPQMNVAGLYWRPVNNIIDVTPGDEVKLIEGNRTTGGVDE